MPLDFDGLFGKNNNLFEATSEDDQVLASQGNRNLPTDQTVDTQALNWRSVWNGGSTYAVNDWVSILGAAYKCILEHTNQQPPNITYWEIISDDTIGIDWKGAWDSGTAYVTTNTVENDGSAYQCKLDHTNQEPPNATYWELISSDTNTQALDYKGDWVDSTTYVIDNWVTNDGNLYKCTAESTDDEPPDTSYWKLVSSDTQTKEIIYPISIIGEEVPYPVTPPLFFRKQLNDEDGIVLQQKIPKDFNTMAEATIIMIPDATETISYDIYAASVAVGQDTESGSEATSLNQTQAVTAGEIEEVDISDDLPASIEASDWLTVNFISNTDSIYPIALRLRYL